MYHVTLISHLIQLISEKRRNASYILRSWRNLNLTIKTVIQHFLARSSCYQSTSCFGGSHFGHTPMKSIYLAYFQRQFTKCSNNFKLKISPCNKTRIELQGGPLVTGTRRDICRNGSFFQETTKTKKSLNETLKNLITINIHHCFDTLVAKPERKQ